MVTTRKKRLASNRWFFIIIAAIVLYLSWKIAEPLAITLVTAAVFGIVLTPIEKRLRYALKSSKLSSIIIVLSVLALIVVPVFLLGVLLVDQSITVLDLIRSGNIPTSYDLRSITLFQRLPISVQEWVLSLDIGKIGGAAAGWAVTNLQSSLSNVVRVILNSAVFFVALYFMLHDREKIHEQILVLSPFKDKMDDQITHRITNTVRNVVFGALIVALIQAVLAAVGMTIFGVPGALLWGALAMIAAQIPFLGISLIMIPAVAYLILSGHVESAIGLAIWAVVVVGLVDNLISPFLIQGRTKMHALLILVSVLGGLQLFGPIGFILGPTVLAGLLVVVDLYKSGILETR